MTTTDRKTQDEGEYSLRCITSATQPHDVTCWRCGGLFAALRAIVRLTDGSQPKDYPGALMVGRAAIAKATGQED